MKHYTPVSARASLGAVALYVRQNHIWEVVEHELHIQQKVIVHRPIDKLKDCFVNILSGGQRLVEVNSRVRPDLGLQRAFGRAACADQSTISDTLNSCMTENVNQLRQALQIVYRMHSQGYRHDYAQDWQLLDVDTSGLPAGRQGEGVAKGYFAGKRNQRGRQVGRVVASLYDEIVTEYLYDGKTQLEQRLQELVRAAEEVLELDTSRRQRTVIRSDGGGGCDDDVNWLLGRGYGVLLKLKHWQRAAKLSRSVTTWYLDPKTGDREVGWVEQPHVYDRPTRQLAIRSRNKKGTWLYRILILNLPDDLLFALAKSKSRRQPAPTSSLFAALYAYDQRSGGVETSFRGSKQGIGLTKRNKKRFAAQEMLVLLAQLAYNLLTWTQRQLAAHAPVFAKFGKRRMIRDVFHISGVIRYDAQGQVLDIKLSKSHPLAAPFVQAMSALLARNNVALYLGQI
jgi:hypothetical protein